MIVTSASSEDHFILGVVTTCCLCMPIISNVVPFMLTGFVPSITKGTAKQQHRRITLESLGSFFSALLLG